jgi:hypothetical protein
LVGQELEGRSSTFEYSAVHMANSVRLIAIMLGRLEMDVEECISKYISLMKSIWEEERALDGRFDLAVLKNAASQVTTKRAKGTGPLNDDENRGCKV